MLTIFSASTPRLAISAGFWFQHPQPLSLLQQTFAEYRLHPATCWYKKLWPQHWARQKSLPPPRSLQSQWRRSWASLRPRPQLRWRWGSWHCESVRLGSWPSVRSSESFAEKGTRELSFWKGLTGRRRVVPSTNEAHLPLWVSGPLVTSLTYTRWISWPKSRHKAPDGQGNWILSWRPRDSVLSLWGDRT